jgi:hypothetical protein
VSASTAALAVVIDAIPLLLVGAIVVALVLLTNPALVLIGVLALLGLLAVQVMLLVRRGRSIGRYLLSVRTVDDLTGLPLRAAGATGALFGRAAGTATVDLRTGRDPFEPSAPTMGARGLTSTTPESTTDAATPTLGTTVRRISAPTPPRSTGDGVAVILDSGQRLVVESSLVIGRNPATDDAEAVFAWPDLSRSLSKNHALLQWTGSALWVTDLGSTNGTAVVASDGARTALGAGDRAHAQVGWTIEFGTRTATIAEVVSA